VVFCKRPTKSSRASLEITISIRMDEMINAKKLEVVSELVPEMWKLISKISKQLWYKKFEYDSSESSILIGFKNEESPYYQISRDVRPSHYHLLDLKKHQVHKSLTENEIIKFLYQNSFSWKSTIDQLRTEFN
jgi:hypothetical protein